MSTTLYITPTRRALLKDVADGNVHRPGPLNAERPRDQRRGSRGVVTASIDELRRADLVWLDGHNWRLTDNGRAALECLVPTMWPLAPKGGAR